MAKKAKKAQKGKAVKQTTTTKVKSTKEKPKKKAGVGQAVKKIAAGLEDRYVGTDFVENITKTKTKKEKGSRKFRRGKVPKTVKKWARKITTRRKQEEKIIKDLFGSDGGKIIKKQKKNSSIGYITPQERMNALNR